MAYRGRQQLGTEITLTVLCVDGNGAPVAPTNAPMMEVYDSAGNQITGKRIPPLEQAVVTGLFQYNLFLGALFSAGTYTVVYRWVSGGNHYGEMDTFEIIPGGHADGSVISLYFYERPGARFLVQQLDSGKLVQGKNPRV
jgi:hypothetical protein